MTALVIDRLTKNFGGLQALHNLSLDIQPGERRVKRFRSTSKLIEKRDNRRLKRKAFPSTLRIPNSGICYSHTST